MRERTAVGDAVGAYHAAAHTCRHFLLLVADDQFDPATCHRVEGGHLVGKDFGAVARHDHLVVCRVDCITYVDLMRVVEPIDGFARCIRSRLSSRRIRELHQHARRLQDQRRYDAVDDIVLGIGERMAQLRTQHHFLAYHQVVRLSLPICSAGQHLHGARLDSRLACLEEAVVDDIHRLGLAANLADRRAEEHIGVGTDTVARGLRRGGNLLVGRDGIVVLIAP